MKTSTKLGQLKRVFSRTIGAKEGISVRFFHCGREVEDTDTPEMLGLQNGFHLDIFIRQ